MGQTTRQANTPVLSLDTAVRVATEVCVEAGIVGVCERVGV